MYDSGQGVPQDYQKAIKYYLKAADQGYAYAQFNIGINSLYCHLNDQPLKYIIDKVYRIIMVRGYNKITTKQ